MRMNWKVVSSLLLMLFLLPTGSFSLADQSADQLLLTEPKILEKDPGAWWIANQTKDIIPNYAYKQCTNALVSTYKANTSKIVDNNLCKIFVNGYNNTIFVVSKSLDEEVIKEYLNVMRPSEDITIKFIKGQFILKDLERWTRIISSHLKELQDKGVRIISVSITVNATILLGIEHLKENLIPTIEDVKSSLPEVPPGALVLIEKEMNKVTGFEGEFRPVIGGLRESPPSPGGGGTLGFYVTWDNGERRGVLTAGHCIVNINDPMYQPSDGQTNRIGVAVAKMSYFGFSDGGLIELDSDVGYSSRIYSLGILNKVVGRTHYDFMQEGDPLEFCGATSGIGTGVILEKYPYTWYPGMFYLLFNQVELSCPCWSGDSGAPVYSKVFDTQTGTYRSIAYGIVWGGNMTLFSPIDGIERDFGITFDYDDDRWSDCFGDGYRDTVIWNNLVIGEGAVTAEIDQLWLMNMAEGSALTGYAAKAPYNINGRSVEVDVISNPDNGQETCLMISQTANTNGDPKDVNNNWYRCVKGKDANGYYWYVEKKINGVITRTQQAVAASTPETMKIAVYGGVIRFFKNGLYQWSESYPLTYSVYPYIYATLQASGQSKVDNFIYTNYVGGGGIPNPPTNLVATAWYSDRVVLSWTDNSQDEVSFEIERKAGMSDWWHRIASVGPNVVSYKDLDVKPGVQYYYRIMAYNGIHYSPYTISASTTLPTPSLYMVVRGGYNNIYYAIKPPGSEWGAWMPVTGGSTITAPATARQGNLLHIVVRGADNGLYHKTINTETFAQSGWSAIGGTAQSAPALTANGDRLSLVVRGTDGYVYYKNYRDGAWMSWQPTGGTTWDSPSAALIGDRLNIVVRGQYNTSYLWHLVLGPSGEVIHPWRMLDGETSSRPTLTAQSGTDTVWLAVKGTNGNLYHRPYTVSVDWWGDWEGLPSTPPSAPSLAAVGDRLYLAILEVGGSLWWGYRDPPGDFWGWEQMPYWALSPPALD
jgi:hypothetical protein